MLLHESIKGVCRRSAVHHGSLFMRYTKILHILNNTPFHKDASEMRKGPKR